MRAGCDAAGIRGTRSHWITVACVTYLGMAGQSWSGHPSLDLLPWNTGGMACYHTLAEDLRPASGESTVPCGACIVMCRGNNSIVYLPNP